MSTLTTDRIANELLEETLLTLDQISTGITVMAINATRDPEQSPRVRQLLGDLVALIQEAQEDLGDLCTLLTLVPDLFLDILLCFPGGCCLVRFAWV